MQWQGHPEIAGDQAMQLSLTFASSLDRKQDSIQRRDCRGRRIPSFQSAISMLRIVFSGLW